MTSNSGTRRKRPRWKTLLFASLTLLFMLAVLELFSYLVLIGILKTDMSTLRQERDQLTDSGVAEGRSVRVAHPYLGSVHNPDVQGETFDGRTIPINKYGFADDKPAIQKRGPDRVVIGIAGGSVAWQFSLSGEKALREALQQTPAFRGKKIVVVRMAISAFKQPQQLFTLNYLLSLGAEFDFVINLDGFNEVALPYSNNIPVHSFYAYPHDWHARSVEMMDPQKSALAWRLLKARGERQHVAQRFNGTWSRYSPMLNLIWKLSDDEALESLQRFREKLITSREKLGAGYQKTGPNVNPKTDAALFVEFVKLWKRCSIQMHGICHANGIEYLHFLQPNQYVKNSKPMSAQERKIVALGDAQAEDYSKAVKSGYPLLIKEGADLVERGVNFHDLTMLFAETETPIYADSCCHFNKRGYEMLAAKVAAAMIGSRSK